MLYIALLNLLQIYHILFLKHLYKNSPYAPSREKANQIIQRILVWKTGSISKMAFCDPKLSLNFSILINKFIQIFHCINNILVCLNMFCFSKPSRKLLLWADVLCLILTSCWHWQTVTYTLQYKYQRLTFTFSASWKSTVADWNEGFWAQKQISDNILPLWNRENFRSLKEKTFLNYWRCIDELLALKTIQKLDRIRSIMASGHWCSLDFLAIR